MLPLLTHFSEHSPHDIKDCSVIFLRYQKTDYEQISRSLIKVLKDYYKSSGHFFITITKSRIRINKI